MKRVKSGRKAEEAEVDIEHVRVQLKPLFGVHPGTYMTAVYAVLLAAGLFFLLVYPGLKSRGTYVTFTSRPAAAAIVVDGVYRGATPAEVLVKAGEHTVEISRPYHATAVLKQSFRGPVFATLLFKPRQRIETDLEIADLDAYLHGSLQDFVDYVHDRGSVTLTEMTRVLDGPAARAIPGIRERLQETLAAAMPFVAPPAGDLSDFLHAEASVAAEGGVLTTGGLVEMVKALAALSSSRDRWVHWVLLNLPGATAEEVEKLPWFQTEHARIVAEDARGGGGGGARGAPATVAGVLLRPIPAGEAFVGDDTRLESRAQTVSLEPAHTVEIPAFYMGETEVTREQFARFLEAEPSWQPSNRAKLVEQGTVGESYLDGWEGSVPAAGTESHPVANVSCYAARAYCEWLTTKLPASLRGYTVRLPFEAEWEWAARGGSVGTQYPGGANPGDAPFRLAGREGTVAAGSTSANGYGLREVMGNVWEWCEDWYAPGAYLMAPVDGAVPDTSSLIPCGSERVVRGGSWANEARQNAVYARGSQPPSWSTPYLGFRVVAVPGLP